MATIINVGADVEDIRRFKPKRRIPYAEFLRYIFTDRELAYCLSQRNPAMHLAARFAGKEAVMKALASAGIHTATPLDYKRIEIERHAVRGPRIRQTVVPTKNKFFAITLSHTDHLAFAVAVLTENA